VTQKEKVMKHLSMGLNWVFGIFFLLIGVLSFLESPLAGLSMAAAAALLLPPARDFVYSKTNIEFSIKARAISILILFIAFGFFSGQSQEQKKQELAHQQTQEEAEKIAQLQKQNIDYFNANREE
jgi:predicted PurR-regulated permease PerM